MTHETVPQNRRIYLVFSEDETGRVGMELSLVPPQVDNALAVILARGEMMGSHPIDRKMLTAVPSLASVLPDITITQTATLAIAAGVRTLTIPAEGVKVGDALVVIPTATVPAGYLIGQAFASAPNQVKVSLQAPLLAIGATYSIPCRLIRLNV